MKELKTQIEYSIKKLDKWIKKNGWKGYDPYDIQELPLFLKKDATIIEKITLKIISKTDEICPLFSRKILKIKKKLNAKAMGLFADAYLNLFKTTKEKKYLEKNKECLTWLENNRSAYYADYCWGYPFDWQSKIFIPKNTPSTVVSSTCGNAFWKYYQHTGEKKYLNICISICNFFLKNLNIDKISKDKICFSYTPLDNFHVHNANLFVAEFLIKIGKETKNQNFIEQGLKAVNYTLGEQNKNGSIYYWGEKQNNYSPHHVDHYHSGFEIRSLYSIWKLTNDKKIYDSISRYYKFYLDNFFENKTIPKFTPQNTYPINIHSCAEAILCNSLLQKDFPQGKKYLENSSKWIIENMQTKEGWFIYKIKNIKGLKFKIQIPYIRWGQAWMLNALSHVLPKLDSCEKNK